MPSVITVQALKTVNPSPQTYAKKMWGANVAPQKSMLSNAPRKDPRGEGTGRATLRTKPRAQRTVTMPIAALPRLKSSPLWPSKSEKLLWPSIFACHFFCMDLTCSHYFSIPPLNTACDMQTVFFRFHTGIWDPWPWAASSVFTLGCLYGWRMRRKDACEYLRRQTGRDGWFPTHPFFLTGPWVFGLGPHCLLNRQWENT
jgi:hypothetical protein